jgi:hypothetical protein
VPFHFQFAWYFRLFEVFELEKFYKQRERRLQLRNRFEIQLKNVRDYLLGSILADPQKDSLPIYFSEKKSTQNF